MRPDHVKTRILLPAVPERFVARGRRAPRIKCPCCSLLVAREDTFQWRETKVCKRLAVLGSEDLEHNGAESWVSGIYRYYPRTETHRVCWTCYEYLMSGGDLDNLVRNRAKLAFIMLMAALVLAVATLPFTLPTILSALWLN